MKGENDMAEDKLTKQLFSSARDVLEQLDNDPKAQTCLKLYQKVPEKEKGTFNMILDAFLRGYSAGQMAGK
jgi:hypothetical protein